MTVRFAPQARRDLLGATEWYLAEGGAKVAERFEDAVAKALRLLSALPGLGSPAGHATRHWPLRRFPYTLVYRAEGHDVVVVAVAHQRRAPDYWTPER